MNRWKITLEYDGSGLCGWQRQEHALSVQQILEEAVEKFSGERVKLYVAGRTDAGVHALGQVAHFDLEKDVDAHTVEGALNFHVRPHRISVLKAEITSPDFNARLSAKSRAYRYLMVNRSAQLALMQNRAWLFPRPLALEPMQEAAALLIGGKRDFSTFRAQHCQANSPMRTLDRLDIARDGEMFIFDIEARSFLYHQVRNMVGTLTLVGTGAWSVADFGAAFEAADRTKGGPTAPADGLYFLSVTY